ncbi:Centromere/kinetochore Zw10-domain-containing protein [Thamnocephalis sphaerospora]|uniref:Centromere/kinetochore Zw10-domain-containing protein n=1 Tax=Thamnocephalis sphaerospora TaxID=78915 RepID=A0A4P9XV61_9FUNG|nr:Centromere/kinetochore Zw10-domain-containing protein [Thamnocephalis sphaerospora]|eukprot:RKP09481.1 Centromere/kinetochore Zw10-domain-containing protein [Thamnocephalis sphaerospora]
MTPERVSRRRSAAARSSAHAFSDNPVVLENRLVARIAECRTQIYQSIHGFYRDFADAYKCSVDADEEMILQLTADLGALAKLTNDDPEGEARVAAHQDAVYVLELLSKIHGQLQEFDQILSAGELLSAAACVHDTASLMSGLDACNERCDEEVLQLLRTAFIKKKSALKARLDRHFVRAITFKRDASSMHFCVRKRISDEPAGATANVTVSLADLFSALASMCMLDERLVWLAQQSIKHLISPLLANESLPLVMKRNRQEATLMLGGHLRNADTPPSQSLLAKLTTIARFLACDVLFSSTGVRPDNNRDDRMDCDAAQDEDDGSDDNDYESFAAPFAAVWHRPFVDAFVSGYLRRTIPSSRSALDDYLAGVNDILRFEKELRQLGLLLPNERPLSTFVRRAEEHYLLKRRTELLEAARDILMSDDRNTVFVQPLLAFESGTFQREGKASAGKTPADGKMIPGGKEQLDTETMPFVFAACHISVQTQTLVDLIHQTLDQAVLATEPNDAVELFCCARDFFHLHRAIIPVHWADELASSPARAAIFYNDCQFIAHHLLALGYRYSKPLAKALHSMATFIDLVPTFRSLGQEQFRRVLVAQRDQAVAYITITGGFQGLDIPERRDRIEAAFKHTAQHCLQLARSWKALLAADFYRRALGVLIDAVLLAIIQQTSELNPMTASEVHQLRYLLLLFTAAAMECFNAGSRIDHAAVAATAAKQAIKEIPCWERYAQLCTLVASSPTELARLLERNSFTAWSGEELRRVVRLVHGRSEEADKLLSRTLV